MKRNITLRIHSVQNSTFPDWFSSVLKCLSILCSVYGIETSLNIFGNGINFNNVFKHFDLSTQYLKCVVLGYTHASYFKYIMIDKGGSCI